MITENKVIKEENKAIKEENIAIKAEKIQMIWKPTAENMSQENKFVQNQNLEP